MNESPIDGHKLQLIRESLEKYLFSDVRQTSDEQMRTHFTFNERPQRSEIVFHQQFWTSLRTSMRSWRKVSFPCLSRIQAKRSS